MKLSNLVKKALPRTLAVGAVMAAACTSSAWAMLVDKQLVVTVVQLCDNSGNNCASLGPAGDNYFEAEVDKIWAQAGIDVKFVFGSQLKNTALLDGQSGVGAFTGALGGTGTTMYLANTLSPSGLYGEAYLSAGGLVINMSEVMSFNAGIGRLDTIAHELGHNLGLVPVPGGHDNSNANFLIASGSVRNIPSSLGQICPDGLCYDLLSQAHIDIARSSSLLIDFVPEPQNVPEPASIALFGAALAAAGAARRRQHAR